MFFSNYFFLFVLFYVSLWVYIGFRYDFEFGLNFQVSLQTGMKEYSQINQSNINMIEYVVVVNKEEKTRKNIVFGDMYPYITVWPQPI